MDADEGREKRANEDRKIKGVILCAAGFIFAFIHDESPKFFFLPISIITVAFGLFLMVPEARKWRIRIHLSTAILLMFAAGGLLWLNTRAKEEAYEVHKSAADFVTQQNTYGWPLPTILDSDIRSGDRVLQPLWEVVFVNGFVALAILIVIGCACETWIQYWETEKRK